MKAHVGADSQLHEFLTSTIELKGYLYAPVANSRYLLGTWLCVFHCLSGCLNGEKTPESHRESNPDFSVFLAAACTQSKNEVRYEVLEKRIMFLLPRGTKYFYILKAFKETLLPFLFMSGVLSTVYIAQ